MRKLLIICLIMMLMPGALAAAPKEYSDRELAALAAQTPEAGVIYFSGPTEGQAFRLLLPSGQTAGRGFWADGRIYIDFSHPEHSKVVEKIYYRARLQGAWLLIEAPDCDDFSRIIVLPVKGQPPTKKPKPWFWIDKAPDQDIYQLMSNWGLTSYSAGEAVLEITAQDLGGPQFHPVFGQVEDVGDVRLFTFARHDDSEVKAPAEMVYSVVYHRLRYKTLGWFERAEYQRSPGQLTSLNGNSDAKDNPRSWWPVLYINDWSGALHPESSPKWDISATEIKITPKSGQATNIAIANPLERRSLIWFGGLFMGAFLGDKIMDIDELHQREEDRAYLPNGTESFGIYGHSGLEGFGRGGQLYDISSSEGGSGTAYDMAGLNIELLPEGHTLDRETPKLGLTGNWNAAPRQATALNTKNATYNKIVKDYLAQNGLPEAEANIVQIFKVDLEGDGIDEVFICAQNYVGADSQAVSWEPDKLFAQGGGFPNGSKAGDYSLILMRKVVDGQAKDIMVCQTIALEDNDPRHLNWSPPELYKIYQFADVNGDGVLELIIGQNYYEGVSYYVYEIKGGEAKLVLSAGWGA